MTDLMEDQEPVMKGPPFNPVVNLSKLSHEEIVTRESQVFTPCNAYVSLVTSNPAMGGL